MLDTLIIITSNQSRFKYCYKHLSIGISDHPDIFQQKMNNLFGFGFIIVCIDELLILTKVYWIYHVQKW